MQLQTAIQSSFTTVKPTEEPAKKAELSATGALLPALKWAGGKRWLLEALEPLWGQHKHRRLVEPFVGGMAVALGLAPKQALLNDSNVHLINFYRWLQCGLVVTLDMVNCKETFYKYRSSFNELIDSGQHRTKEAAELFYYMNRTCYNGLCRFNSKGNFNVPFGKYKTINYTKNFERYKGPLSQWSLSTGDFSDIEIKSDDFIYADPPYDVEFTSYSPGGFDWKDQERLAQWLAAHKGPVIASNQATERVLYLYQQLGFECFIIDAPRMISCTGNRTRAKELLALKGVWI